MATLSRPPVWRNRSSPTRYHSGLEKGRPLVLLPLIAWCFLCYSERSVSLLTRHIPASKLQVSTFLPMVGFCIYGVKVSVLLQSSSTSERSVTWILSRTAARTTCWCFVLVGLMIARIWHHHQNAWTAMPSERIIWPWSRFVLIEVPLRSSRDGTDPEVTVVKKKRALIQSDEEDEPGVDLELGEGSTNKVGIPYSVPLLWSF